MKFFLHIVLVPVKLVCRISRAVKFYENFVNIIKRRC